MNSKVVLLALVLSASHCAHQRFKRVINGVPLEDISKSYGRPTTYSAIRYYGAIAHGHVYRIFKYMNFLGVESGVFCSGSILTPRIFQTACHCLASFPNDPKFVKPPVIHHHWQGRDVIYLGVSNVYGENSMVTTTPLLSEKFVIHEKCGKLGNGAVPTFDYGLIIISNSWIHADDRRYRWTEIDWAPLYAVEEIETFHEFALQEQLVCLHIGFGYYKRTSAKTSNVLRHGWGVLQTTERCYAETAFSGGVALDEDPLVMWDCGMEFPQHQQEVGEGDSGGPITCDNIYFGVASGKTFSTNEAGIVDYAVTKYHPLTHNLYVNALEYRESLISVTDDLTKTYNHMIQEGLEFIIEDE